MSRYHLTEAYGELYNPRLTEASFYDNLRFVDYLQQEEIEEVMESLIWEFMDYGDTFEEAVNTLEATFSDEEILSESLELISEAMSVSQRRSSQRGLRGNYSAQDAARFKTSATVSGAKATKDLESASQLAKRSLSSASDSAARARRASRSSAIRGALGGAKRNVSGALSRAHKSFRDAKAQLKKTGTEVSSKAQAALAKVGRGGRRLVNAAKGAYQGAKSGYNAPLSTPAPRTPGRVQTQQTRTAAAAANGNVFAKPKATLPVLTQKPPLPPRPRAAVASSTATAKPAPKPRQFGSAATRARLAKTSEKYQAEKQKLNNSVDYDLLTQYMIEDLIEEGYADTESQAVSILENMTTETLTEFASIYLDD
jgi:hypothetical protein